MQYKHRFVVLLVFLLLLAGCASTGTNTVSGDSTKSTVWKTLMTGKQAYDKTFTTLGILYKQGKLSEQAKDNAIKYGNVYLAAHNQAVQDLLDGKTPNLDVVNKALDEFLTQAAVTGGK